MTAFIRSPRVRLSLAILAVANTAAWAVPGGAQLPVIASTDDAVERLGRFIRILTASPRDMSALLGAGQAALDVGDPNAALGFFARAETADPSNARAKAGLGSALVMIERPEDALRLFAEATARGASEVDIARDRGLAYDLRGDTARAQRDYALATTRRGDDELVRRYALSLGIAGNRDAAIAKLDPLLRRQDQGAWRARAFILAMTGDVPGANGVARALMPPVMANAMAPLLTRLATLDAAGRAHAVNFGTIPSDGTQMAVVVGNLYREPRSNLPAYATVPAVGAGLIPQGEPLGPRKPGRTALTMAGPAGTTIAVPTVATALPVPTFTQPPTRIVAVDPLRLPPELLVARVLPTTRLPANAPLLPQSGSLSASNEIAGPPAATLPARAAAPQPATAIATAIATVSATTPVVFASQPQSRLAGLLAGLTPENETSVELPSTRELRLARSAARRKTAELAASEVAERETKVAKAKVSEAARRNPPRLWVQVATGSNDSGLALTWKRMRRDNEAALTGLSAWSAPFKATNRILVGPIASTAAARALVRRLDQNGVRAVSYASEAGEEVARIAGR